MGFGDFVEGVGNAFHDAGASVFGYDTVAEKEAKKQAEQAAKTGEQERDALAKQNRALQEGVSGYDQPAISQCVNWSSYSHEQIFNTNRDTIDEGRADEVGTAWNNLGKRLRERGAPFEAKLKEIIGGGWQGEAAEQAKTVGEPVKMWMEYSGNAFEMTGNKLKEAASAAGQVKQTVPEPQGHDWGRTAAAAIPMGLVGGGGDALAQMEERKQAEKGAQEAMGRIYSPTFTNVDSHMPQYQKPDGTVVEPPPARPPEETDWGKRPVVDDRNRTGIGPGDSGTGIGGGVGSGVGGGGGSGSGSGGGGGFGSGGSGGSGAGGGGGYGGGSGGGGGYTPPAGTDSAWSKPPTVQPGYGNLPPAPGPGSGGGNPPGAFGAMPPAVSAVAEEQAEPVARAASAAAVSVPVVCPRVAGPVRADSVPEARRVLVPRERAEAPVPEAAVAWRVWAVPDAAVSRDRTTSTSVRPGWRSRTTSG
ncbi:PPE domain-containing protein [Saccharopolyspora spinosporotrichia]|uniref:PPE domain-containing protein n=1 Tax=Saccharopolyspora erythraea TaxID=1836 RepID=UPI000426136C|nr:PPE domain-containing protein [Saccharopolyspora erythraea]